LTRIAIEIGFGKEEEEEKAMKIIPLI